MSVFAGVDPLVQRLALRVSTAWHRRRRLPSVDWVVGPVEVAGLAHAMRSLIPSTESDLMYAHPFYAHTYDWIAPNRRTHLGRVVRGPWRLGALIARSKGFIYLGGVGYLDKLDDGGAFELGYLKAHGKRVVCYFTGNDIRSPRLSAELEAQTGEPNFATYLAETGPEFATERYEQRRRDIASSAESFADLIFNADRAQLGYLTRPSEPFLYFHPDSEITANFDKFARRSRPVIVHAPSSPVLKGTQLVRAAIRELRDDGYEFEYVELVRQSHAEVTAQLRRAHIVLNQFFSEVPGVFGVEGLAAGCVVVQRADEHDEPSLPAGSNEAWVVTRHHQVARHLRRLLEDPTSWEAQARRGVEWVRAHAAASVTGPVLVQKLTALIEPARDA
ncbi:MAG: hypothetical protein J0G30_05845 [Actinomycetales bacterium]|nr:hypothetical protein [Actinomycetales bacterium]